jgi:hypothetical protein
MTPSNRQRADRCQKVITAYSDDDDYTNLVDLLTDAMHFCHANGHSVADAFDTALAHHEAEITDDDSRDNLNRIAASEENRPMSESTTVRNDARKRSITSLADEALQAFWQVIVQRYPQATTGDLSPWATIKLQIAAENAIGEWIDNNVPATTTKGD